MGEGGGIKKKKKDDWCIKHNEHSAVTNKSQTRERNTDSKVYRLSVIDIIYTMIDSLFDYGYYHNYVIMKHASCAQVYISSIYKC